MKNKKSIIVIVIALVILILAVILIYYGVDKKTNLITKDTLFLCPSSNTDGKISKILASDKVDINSVCNGQRGYKYECQLDYCSASIGAQSFDSYYSYSKGIGIIYEGEAIENAKKFL